MDTTIRLLTTKATCEKLGGRSRVWLWRRRESDPTFPRPVFLTTPGKPMYLEHEVDAYIQAQAAKRDQVAA